MRYVRCISTSSSLELDRHLVLSIALVHHLEELLQGDQVILRLSIHHRTVQNSVITYVGEINLVNEPLGNFVQFLLVDSLHHLGQDGEQLVLGDLPVPVQVVHAEGEPQLVRLTVQLHFLGVLAGVRQS